MSLPTPISTNQWPASWPSYPSLVRLARGIAGRRGDAEGLAHAAMERGLQADRGESSLGLGWFAAVMRNVKHSAYRRTRTQVLGLTAHDDWALGLTSTDPSPAEESMRRESAERLMCAVDGLPTRRRDIVRLRYLEGLTAAQVASEMDVSLSTVERESRRALDGLARDLDGDRRGARSGAWLGALVGADGGRKPWAAEAWSMAGTVLAVALPVAVIVGALLMGGDRQRDDLDGTGRGDPVATPVTEPGPSEPMAAGAITGRAKASSGDGGADLLPGPGGSAGAMGLVPLVPVQPQTHTFSVDLIVDGEPIGANWRSMTPRWEPDAVLGDAEERPRCSTFTKNPVDGRFEFQLPEKAGVWLFRFVNDDTKAVVYLQDEGVARAPRSIAFSTGTIEIDTREGGPFAGLEGGKHVVCCNTEPGCWVCRTLRPVEGKPHILAAEGVAMGANWCADVKGSYIPDAWPRVGPAVVTPNPR